MGTADLHVHSTYSKDGTTTVRGVLKQASMIGLNVVAITDHDEIRGALEARELASAYGVEVVPGIEVSTLEGHLLALYVEEIVPAGQSLIDTLLNIGDLGGLAIAPHPINPLPKSMSMDSILTAQRHEKAGHVLKGVEVYNMGHEIFNRRVQKLTAWLKLAKTAGSDSHIHWTIGMGRTGFEDESAEELRLALENMTTTPIPAPYSFSLRPIVTWMGHSTLRRLGFVSDNLGPEQPIAFRRSNKL